MLIGNLTHVGMERSENQDYYGYYEPEDDREFELQGRLIIVCDGMGGHAGGEVASRLAVNTIIEHYRADKSGNIPEALRKAIEAANRAIWEYAQQHPELKGMGSTCVSMVMRNGEAIFGHVGDSRAYLVRGEQLVQLTRDHSLVQQMVEEGLLQESEMENHPEKNVILRSLGVKPDVEVDINVMPYQVDDIFLLSTDGLTGLVSKEECLRIALLHKDNPMEAARLLVDLANKYGGYDNITVQLARVRALSPKDVTKPPPPNTTTAMFTPEDVQRSIAEARAKAVGAAAKVAPTAAEMAGNVGKRPAAPAAAPAPGGKGVGITTALAAPTKEELEAAKAEAMARAAAARQQQSAAAGAGAAGAAAGKGGGAKMMAIAVVAAVAMLVGGLVVGSVLNDRKAAALEALARAEARAEALRGTDKHKQAMRQAEAAREKARGLFGFTAIDALEDATRALEALAAQSGARSTGAASSEDADRAKKLMNEAKPAARESGAAQLAPVEWEGAEQAERAGDEAYAARNFGVAANQYARARDAYREAAEKAALKEAAKKLAEAREQVKKALSEASLYAKDWFPELLEDANRALAEADALEKTNAIRALDRVTYAAGLLRGANRFAVDFEKKN